MIGRSLATAARYAIPSVRNYVVPRARLLDRLHTAIGSGLTVIQAPGGYGKSTIAAQFAHDLEFEARWLTLDSSSHAPEALAEQLVGAMLGADAWQPATTEGDGALSAYLGAALREFDATAPAPLLLVIDNAHELNATDASRELVAWLLHSLPQGAEVLLLAREPVRLPDLDRHVASGEALMLVASDLAFTEEEVAAVLEKADRPDLDPQVVHATTGGWPVAVRGILSGTLSPEDAGHAVAGGVWDRYLVSEVWAAVPAELQMPLMMAAVAPTAEARLLAPVLSPEPLQELGRWLDVHDFFVEHINGDDRRINPVVQRFLRDRFRSDAPEAFAETAAAVVRELQRQQRVIDALELTVSLDRQQELAALIRQHAPELLQRGSFFTLQRAINAVSESVLEEDRCLLSIHARVLAQVGRPEDALAAAESVLDRPGDSLESLHHARLARARALRMLGRMDEVVAALDAPLDDLPSDRNLQVEFAWHRAHAALAVDSNLDRALQLLNECLQSARDTNAPLLELLCRSTIGQVLVMKGDGPGSVTELEAAARGWREQQGAAHTAWVLNNLGMAHIMVGDMDSAVRSLTEARDESVIARDQRAEAFAVASLGDAYLASSDAARARFAYEEAIKICAEHPLDQSLVALATSGLAGALLELGELGRADFVARRSVEMAEQLGSPFELGSCLLQQAAIASASELHAEAIQLASRAIELLSSIGAEAALRTARYRLALIYFRDGDREAAEQVIGELSQTISAPWMAKGLEPLLREHLLFAQWVEQRAVTALPLRKIIQEVDINPPEPPAPMAPAHPRIMAQSLGAVRVFIDGEEVADEAWESIRAKELFYLFLSRPDGVRKEEAFEQLYPELPASRCNSQFHSNLYRIRKALYKESIVKRDGTYLLNPDAEFDWDVEEFQSLLDEAISLPSGSPERAAAYEQALQLYRGPFAETFYSEWAASLRESLARRKVEALASLGGYYAGRKEFEAAAACMEQVLKASRFNDEAAVLLATYRCRAGQPTAALAFLDDYRHELLREMSEDLSPRLQRLRHAIASGAPV